MQPSTAVAAGNCNLGGVRLVVDNEEADLIGRINNYRAQAGLGPLAVSPALTASATWKSNDMAANSYFGHDDLNRSWSQRVTECGYASSANASENIAAGNADGATTFDMWRNSSGHNANMLSASMRVIGVARAYRAGSPYGWYWTANFGSVADTTP